MTTAYKEKTIMKINNTLFACILLIMGVSHVNAQSDKNICYKVGIGTVEYAVPEQKTTVGSVIGGLAEAALTGKNTISAKTALYNFASGNAQKVISESLT